MRKSKAIKENTSGVIMLESLIVVTVTVFLLFFILAAFSTMFQRFNIQIIANETAARLAQTYEYSLKADSITGDITLDDAVNVDPYRYFKGEELASATQRKAKEYASGRLKKTTFTKDVSEPSIASEVISDSLGRRHLEVTIKGSYSVPFGDILGYFGFEEINDYSTVAYADCIDLSNYINTVVYVDTWTSGEGSKLIDAIDNVFELIDNVLDLFGI